MRRLVWCWDTTHEGVSSCIVKVGPRHDWSDAACTFTNNFNRVSSTVLLCSSNIIILVH